MKTTRRARTLVPALALSFPMFYDDAINDAPVIDPSSSPAIVAPFLTSESA
jgi:hypothetical protein